MRNKIILVTALCIFSAPVSAKITSDLNIEDVLLYNPNQTPVPTSALPDYSEQSKQHEAQAKAFKSKLNTVTKYKYDQSKTYKLKLSTYLSTIISLPEGEKVISYQTGDGNNFVVNHDQALPNMLMINTLSNGYYSNLLVVTDKGKIYNFYLKSDSEHIPDFTVYIEKNEEELKAELLDTLKSSNQNITHVKNLNNLNTAYEVKGDKDIAPVYVYDDGKFTYFDFGNNFISDRLPTIYKIVDEQDTVVNNHTEGNLIVAQTLSPKGFVLKNGDKHVCIKPVTKLSEVYKNAKSK